VPPDQVPSLSAGNSYLLVVEAVGGKSSIDEGVESLSFTVLDPTERERVQSLVQRLRSELVIVNADSTFVDFAQASFFFDLQLYAEARSLLENIHTRSDGTTATYMLLARVQYETGLTIAAATSYTHAYSLAVVTDELEVQAYAAWQLGMIYRNLRQNEETQRWLDLAAEHYEKLGDSTMVQQIHNTEHTSP
jgi:tetratricopeptide (TPR) repeat protein